MTGNEQLVQELISDGILKSPQIIDAFRTIDRKDFVPEKLQGSAYDNAPLPIGHGQTISQPLTVAFMLELLQPQVGDKILDVGSGSGWVTALLAQVVSPVRGRSPRGGRSRAAASSRVASNGVSRSQPHGMVFSMELVPELCHVGEKNVQKYNFIEKGIVEVHCMSAVNGLPSEAPFNKIIAAAASTEIPQAWKSQLSPGGRIVAPVRSSVDLVVKHEDGTFQETHHPGFAFVPFVS